MTNNNKRSRVSAPVVDCPGGCCRNLWDLDPRDCEATDDNRMICSDCAQAERDLDPALCQD